MAIIFMWLLDLPMCITSVLNAVPWTYVPIPFTLDKRKRGCSQLLLMDLREENFQHR